MAMSRKLFDAIVDGKVSLAQATVQEELAAGGDPVTMIAETMIPAMDEVGKLFQEEEYFVPELMLAGRAMKAAMEPLRPLLAASGAKPSGVVLIGTVQGDLHDIGKNLVGSMLEGSGFKVVDLGTNVTPRKFVDAIRQHEPQILCLSALLTVTIFKVFLHDLWRLGQLFRVASFVGLAIVLILVSFLYQKFLGKNERTGGAS